MWFSFCLLSCCKNLPWGQKTKLTCRQFVCRVKVIFIQFRTKVHLTILSVGGSFLTFFLYYIHIKCYFVTHTEVLSPLIIVLLGNYNLDLLNGWPSMNRKENLF